MTRRLATSPAWEYTSPRPLIRWYGNVELHGPHAIGYWFCLDLETGQALWDHEVEEANTIRFVSEHVIVASRMTTRGPTTFDVGMYAIDRFTGETRWKGEGVPVLALLFSFLPWVNPHGAGTPEALVGTELFTSEREVLDVETGRFLRKVERGSIPESPDSMADPAFGLYTDEDGIKLPGGDWLVARCEDGRLLVRRTGSRQWYFDLADRSRYVDGSFYSWRFLGKEILIVAADAPPRVSEPDRGVVEKPCRSELLVVDVENGQVVQDFPLTTERGAPCRMEDMDERCVLVSREKTLRCYRWVEG